MTKWWYYARAGWVTAALLVHSSDWQTKGLSHGGAAPLADSERPAWCSAEGGGFTFHHVKLTFQQSSKQNLVQSRDAGARAPGETEQRLYALSAWRETPFLTDRERAALEWTEAVTQISQNHVPDDVFESVRRHFTEADLINLTLAVIGINSWNRVAISFRAVPGTYQPQPSHTAR